MSATGGAGGFIFGSSPPAAQNGSSGIVAAGGDNDDVPDENPEDKARGSHLLAFDLDNRDHASSNTAVIASARAKHDHAMTRAPCAHRDPS